MISCPPHNLATIPQSDPFGFSADLWLERLRNTEHGNSLGEWMGYEVLSPAMRGGQARVYKCRRGDGAVVAVKQIHGGARAMPAASRRLQRELKIAGALNHPHIVSARPVNVGAELLLESDWIDGRPLTQWSAGDEGQTAPDEFAILRVMIGVCDAIAYAHDRGVIHRDLKPSNILVDGESRPHILDFGLAGTLADFADITHATLTEPLVGTPAYASPEQIAGDPSRIDARTDIYSVGVILYESFTGVSPYPPDLSLGRLLHAVEHVEPLRPRLKNPHVPRAVEAVILKALRKNPAERYESTAALRADLQRCLEGSKPSAPHPGLWFDLRAFAARNRTFSWIVACTACALLAGGLMVAAYAARLTRAQDATLAAHHAAERANQVLSDMIERAAPPIDDAGRRLVAALDGTAGWIDEELRGEPWALARAHVSMGTLYAKAQRWKQADRHLSRAINEYRRLGEPDRRTVADVMRLLALSRAYLGLPDAVDQQRQALALAQRLRRTDSTEIANFHASLAETLLVSGGPSARSEAEDQIRQATSILQSAAQRFPAWEAELLAGYARALLHANDPAAAVQKLQEASSLFEEAHMPIETCPYHRASMDMLAKAYESLGDVTAASKVRHKLDELRNRATSIPPYTKGE